MLIFRIDDRLIHGQVTVSWVNRYRLEKIIIVDDKLNSDPLGKMLALSAAQAMKSAKVDIISTEDAIERLKVGGLGKNSNVMLLFKEPITLLKVIKESGVKVDWINLGNMGYKTGREAFEHHTGSKMYASPEEKEAFREMINMGIKVIVQVLGDGKGRELKLD
ncbi:MAG: PTS sugar transporter subunit IIB [Candidatus Asgardarchaeia archaeon]